MSNKVYVDLKRSSEEKGQMDFTTNYNEEIVRDWLNDDEELPYTLEENVFDWEGDFDNNYHYIQASSPRLRALRSIK